MASIQGQMIELDDLSMPSNIPQSNTSSDQAGYHYFHVHCLSEEKTLKDKKYASVDDIKKDAFALYPDWKFNDDNAILTHLDKNQDEVLLITVPNLSEKNHSKDLFIRFVHPFCAICSNPFGIVDSQLLYQCSEVKCDTQYCNSCVQAVQGLHAEYSFVCISCKREVIPKHNILLQKHIIWKNMCKLYGIQSFLDLKVNSKLSSRYPILKNIKFRITHLKSGLSTLESRLNTYNNRRRKQNSSSLFDQQLINNVNNLCTELEQLTKRIKETNKKINQLNTTVKDNLTKYKDNMKKFDHLWYTSTIPMIKYQTIDSNITTTDNTDIHQEYIKLISINDLDKLSSEQNIKVINEILQDIINHREYLLSRLKVIKLLLDDQTGETKLLQDNLEQGMEMLKIIPVVKRDLIDLCKSQQATEGYLDEYDKLLRDDDYPETPCSKFILLLEKMRILSEELEISEIFPETIKLKEEWQNDHGTNNNFKPKVFDLFETIEMDLKFLLSDKNWIYSVPYKIGVIGAGSVGKSALIMNLANLYDFPSMIAAERNTFCYLQFDTLSYKDPYNSKIIPITFVDVEGATDTDKHQANGNYIELINKVDCDLYIIMFDNLFNEHNRTCQEYIEKKLQRKCLLVRNKADVLFNDLFREETDEKYTKEHSTNSVVDQILRETNNQARKTFDDKRLENEVYLTAVVCDDNLKGASLATFDLDELKKKFVDLAITESRGQRICDLAIRTSIIVINTCFRRGYTVSKKKYQLLAAVGSLIPCLDELPAFFGREKIRQAFGIHDHSTVANAVHGTKDSFEKYLMKKQFTVPEDYLKSGEFKYLIAKTTKQTTTNLDIWPDMRIQQKPIDTIKNKIPIPQNSQTWVRHTSQTVTKPVVASLITVSSLTNDAARFIIPTTAATLHAISIASIVVGAVLTPLFAAWSFYSTGKRMNKKLHLICDDLVVILQYLLVDVCNHCLHPSPAND